MLRRNVSHADWYFSLAVENHQVVQCGDSGDRRLILKAGVRSVPVVLMEPERQILSAVAGGLIGPGIGPFPQGGLDKTLCLAVGLRRISSAACDPLVDV